MKSTLHTLLLVLALSGGIRTTVLAQTCTQFTSLNYGASGTANGDRRTATATVGGTTITTNGYSTSVSGSNTNVFAVGTNSALPSKALVWQQNTQGATGAVAGQPTTAATVTYSFSRPVTNLTLVLADIDADASAGKFTDKVTLDGYVNATDATPITLVAADVVLGNQNAFVAGSNAVQGTGNSNADAANNVTVTFPQPVTKLVLSYQNAYPYNASDDRTQAMGINSISFCSKADVYAQFTAGPTAATAGQNVAYTVTFGNSGPDIAAGTVTRKVTVPAGATVTSLGGGTQTGNTIDFGNVNSLAVGASTSFTYAYNLPSTAGTYTNTATITAGTTATAFDPTANNTASRSVLAGAGAGACTTAPADLDFRTRPAGENWKAKVLEGVPVPTAVTKVSTTYSSPNAGSTLAVGALNGPSLRWSVDYAGGNNGDPNASTVTYTFSRPVANFSVRVQDIDGDVASVVGIGRSGFTDQVEFVGSNAGTNVVPLVSKVVPGSTTLTVSGSVATANTTAATSADNGAVIASFPSEITSLTLIYRNVISGSGALGAATDYAAQAIGIDMMSWCRVLPVANNVTTATLPSSAGQVGISPLSASVDGSVELYTLTSVPTAAQGVLYYNASGSTYTAITAAGLTLTPAQAATLRFDPAAGAAGSVTFGYTVQDDASLTSNTATYTIPVSNVICTVNTTTLAFASRPAGEDWKAHAAEGFPAGSPRTTLGSGAYATPSSATTSTFMTAPVNGVPTLQWLTDYANTTEKSSSVTFTFNRAVSNFMVRVQDIDAVQDNGNSFIDRVTFSGANSGTPVTPVLSAVNPDNGAVIISGNVATGTVNNTSPDDASVVAYFASPITSLTLTYTNNSTFNSNPTPQAVGIDLMSWCQLAPTANAVAGTSLPASASQTAISPLSGTADGVIQLYTLGAVTAGSGVLYVNGVPATAGQQISPAQAAQLSFDPAPGFVGTAAFTYTATDGQGNVSAPATYSVPVTAVADVTTTLGGPASLNPGQASGTYTATFSNAGPSTASGVVQRVSLPAGATNVLVNGVSYAPSGSIIDFGNGTPATLASGAVNTFTFSFTPAATDTGSLAVASSVSTTTPEGANASPNSSTINASVAPVADVVAAITASAASVPAGTLATAAAPAQFTATFSNAGPVAATGVVAKVQLPAGLTNVTATNNGQYDPATGLVTYPGLSTIASGSVASVITFDAPVYGPVVATASIATATSEANRTANDLASASIGIAPAFDLVSMLSGPASAVQGNLVTLALTTANNGPSAAPGAMPSIQLVGGLLNVYVSNGGSYDSGSGLVTFPAIGSLPSGQAVVNSVSFKAPATAFAPVASITPNTTAGGETAVGNNTGYLNGAAASTSLTIATPTSNTSNVYTKITTTTPNPSAGSPVAVTVVTGNNGPTAAPSVVQLVQLAPGLAASIQLDGQSGTVSGSEVTFTSGAKYNVLTGLVTYPSIGSQASGSSVSSTITFSAPTNAANNGQLLLMASVAATNSDPVTGDNVAGTTVTVAPTSDLAATLLGPGSVVVGQPVRYTATFVNNGPAAAGGYNQAGTQTSGVREMVQLPAGLPSVSITDAAGAAVTGATYDALTGLVTFPTLTTDPVGAMQVYNITFIAPAQNMVVRGSVTTAQPDGSLTSNSASLATAVSASADLTTTVAGPAMAVAGNAVTYSLTTTNGGPSTAASVVPTIRLAPGLTIVDVPNGTYDSASGLVTFGTTASLTSGASLTNSVTFVMPNLASGQVTGLAAATAATYDPNSGNAAASVATSVAPATAVAASATSATSDVAATVSASAASLAAGASLTITASFGNSGTDAATGVMPILHLPAGLTMGTISNSGVYNSTTGVVSWPAISSLANSASVSYTATFTAPATGPVVATASAGKMTSEPATATAQRNDVAQVSVAITPTFDELTSLAGPASALPGTSQTYTVTAINDGTSPTNNATTQTVTLPAGLVATNISGGAQQVGNTITWTIAAGQLPGAAGAVANTFTLVQPATGITLGAAVTVSGETNVANGQATLTTAVTNQPPLAYAVVNTLQGPRGNTANALAIAPLLASDAENALSSTAPFTLVSVPLATQGILSYDNNGTYATATAGQTLTATQAATLRFRPAAGYVGNASFTYLVTDNAGNQSSTVNYTIPVAADLSSTYAAYNSAKGGSSKYVTNDVLAQVLDPNTVVYNSTGAVYSPAGVLQSGAANGLATTGTNAVLASGTLPTGVSLDPATGRIYVSNAALLPRITTATSYTVSIVTIDLNGGTNTVPANFTLGAYPLPVELTAFTATAVHNLDASLAWRTASEKSNDHFEVERSFTGTDYEKIGQVQGQGSKAGATDYTLTDAAVARKASGPVYYRLKQVDTDGTATYSPVRTVAFTTASMAPAIVLYPNPATAATTLDLGQLPAGRYTVQVLDATGRVVLRAQQEAGIRQVLELTSIASGAYTVRVSGPSLNLTKRLVKE
jgi:uncharacterized repeat protein (TIGR01451 family)